jgi:hypothetical protein
MKPHLRARRPEPLDKTVLQLITIRDHDTFSVASIVPAAAFSQYPDETEALITVVQLFY